VNNNSFGCYAEYLFCAECTKRGFIVSMPTLDSSHYDCIVDNGKKIYKIQIKSSRKIPTDRVNSVLIPIHSYSIKYTKEKVDFFAVFSNFYEGFFIFPNNGTQQSFRASLKGLNKIYYNNFDLLKKY